MVHTLLLVCLPLVSASVYPTEPIQATVWSAGQPALVSWTEDGRYPTLREMGRLDIALWRDTDTFLVELASNVDPMAKTRAVTVPAAVLKRGSTYTLRFTTTRPVETVVYSADFAIVDANATTTTTTALGSGFGTVTTTTTVTGSASGASDASLTAPLPSGTTRPGDGAPATQGQGQGQGRRVASAGRRTVDVEKLKFRFVFVIWPVLMGVTMAL